MPAIIFITASKPLLLSVFPLIGALPVLSYLLFRRRAERVTPKVRDWMNTNSWLVNILVCVVFIVLMLA